ncbi:ABC transporter permease [Paenibacillus marinisediminis]
MLFTVLARKAYARNLQYRGAHMVHNIASFMFGFIYVSIWAGVGADNSLGEYGVHGMTSYIAFNQCVIWLTLFQSNGLGIAGSVRTGQIAFDMMRPVHLFYERMSREWGQQFYQLIYKFLPIYTLYFFIFSLQLPNDFTVYVWTAIAILMGAYISICIQFLIGIAALWTTESRWLYWVNYALTMLLSGFFIPLEWTPDWLRAIGLALPYPYLLYYPNRIYMQMESASVLSGAVAWAVCLTGVCLLGTAMMRHRLEVQGG